MIGFFLKRVFISFGVVLALIVSASFFMGSTQEALPSDNPPLATAPHIWTETEKQLLNSLWLEKLPAVPVDTSNVYADNNAAARLGHKLFFDTRLSANGQVSCATCHRPELNFTDGLPRSKGIGETPRASMTITGIAYSDWFFWDGRADSLWAQALGPTENPVEHGGNRGLYAGLITEDTNYRLEYEAIFGPLSDISDYIRFPRWAGPLEDPKASAAWQGMSAEDQDVINRIFVNMGKAIAAYERLIIPGPAKFDRYVSAVIADDVAGKANTYTESEANGLRIFIGKGKCIDCHNGPLFTNNAFHNTGVPPAIDLPADLGRIEGVGKAITDPFNCVGDYSDANPRDCVHLRFAKTNGNDLIAAFKVPTLRNVEKVAPYMHAGQFPTLTEAVMHYNRAPASVHGTSELTRLHLHPIELKNLVAFLKTLNGPMATSAEFLAAPVYQNLD